ncbi:MAG TPA: ABC transporter permease subunit [Acetobacteraceae bacterium]|nr:ABC transporter permease subunit [Acetobacteraceae bacterium]
MPVSSPDSLGLVAPLAVLGLAAGLWPRLPPPLGAGLALLALLGLLGATGLDAAQRLQGMPPAARAGLGGGFWLGCLSAAGLVAAACAGLRPAWRVGLAALGSAALLAMGWAGTFDALSLVVEYRARQEAVHQALGRHLLLSAMALLLALLLAVPLALAALRRPWLAAASGGVLSGVQVVPAIALFALLIPALAALLALFPSLRATGLGAIGPAPAVIATALYLALPLFGAVLGGLRTADPDAVAAARAMGMAEGRITREVRLPLALPVFAGGLRVALVQAVGLVTLGGLVGAGGLGAIVFEGLSQFATDLMLLGALPVVALALLADALARLAERRLAAGT